MSVWRRVGFSGILMGAIGLGTLLTGCDGGSGGTASGPNPEVQIVPTKDAQGNTAGVNEGEIPK